MLNLAAEGIGVIMCGILSATPIPVNSHSINALEIKKETVLHHPNPRTGGLCPCRS